MCNIYHGDGWRLERREAGVLFEQISPAGFIQLMVKQSDNSHWGKSRDFSSNRRSIAASPSEAASEVPSYQFVMASVSDNISLTSSHGRSNFHSLKFRRKFYAFKFLYILLHNFDSKV